MNGKDYGNIPQSRERIYIVGFKNEESYKKFKFPDKIELTTTLRDVIDFSGKKEDCYYYSKDKNSFYDSLENAITSQDTIYQW